MNKNLTSPAWRKIALQALIGAAAGYLGARALMGLGFPLPAEKPPLGAVVLAGIGLIYALMGLFVGIGAALPGAGARVLNVADRDDLIDQRAILVGSGVSCLVLGAALILLAMSAPVGPVPGVIAASALAAAIALLGVVTIAQWRRYDELLRGISLEACAITVGLLLPVLTMWAALAHIGLVAAIDPLGAIALIAGIMLLASFIAGGRRGLLLPA